MDFAQQRPRASSAQSRQPAHRRPSWAKQQISYDIYMRPDLAAGRFPGADSNHEKYSYDDLHLKQWPIPEDILSQLPPEVKRAAQEWKYTGAAVCTALERISKLDDESLHRGYPEKTLTHLSRRPSVQSQTLMGPQTPPMSSPPSPGPMAIAASGMRLEKLNQFSQYQLVGMESPPFTPVNTGACPTPDAQTNMTASTAPDLQALSQQLSPLSIATSRADSGVGSSVAQSDGFSSSFGSTFSSISSNQSSATFDEAAWETFLKAYDAELFDIRTHSGPRLKGAGYTIDKARVEWGSDKNHDKTALAKFNEWWSNMKVEMAKYDDKIRELEAPNIDTVRAERMAYGMSI
ncbi:hypothetical protein Slin15195_G053010 [Septoria linicola]|uniref:Uncharacterized protein n=1 Tax=Septoria linicola TaxID=215465 RepID=A0A9Q9AM48_9PEZI|nr:hypothetical protein Slin14017_G123800 [Septoria linicola]USW51982.1 hypothetical protein Slin15195_G053010 [Septoria linicola]